MPRRRQYARRWTNFHDPPRIENEHSIRHARKQQGAVCDQNDRKPELLPEAQKDGKNLTFCRGVERCRGLIGNDQGWPAGNCLCDQHSLALTPAQLVWIRSCNPFAVRGKQFREDLPRSFAPESSGQTFVPAQNFAYLITYPHGRVERHRGFLIDHGEATTTNALELSTVQLQNIPPLESNSPPLDSSICREQTQKRCGESALPRSRFSEHA
jgi:hypothetical protein